ncbi:MAG: fumarate hydratase [Candidatus Hodarchaeales archaeon]|jgi:fumarate hydratase subunit alpha
MENKIEETIKEVIRLAVTDLPIDVNKAIHQARDREKDAAKAQMEAIIENIELARDTSTTMCQDSGYPIFFVKMGHQFKLPDTPLSTLISNVTLEATKSIPLRPNTVHLFKGNPGDNSGKYAPWINYDVVEGDFLEITYLPKGGGAENMTQLGMLKPGQGLKGVKELVVKTVIDAHSGQPCNPIVISVGIGGGSDIALKIAKSSLAYRNIGERNTDPDIAKLEADLLEAVNMIGYGPMGLGGETTVLEVFVEIGMRHPASLPVGVLVQCWANRRATARIYNDGRVEYLTHNKEAA